MRAFIALSLLFVSGCDGRADAAVKAAIRDKMLDPDAAQFRAVEACPADKAMWKGEVNGKNAYGAYTGFRPFFFAASVAQYPGDASYRSYAVRCFGQQFVDKMDEEMKGLTGKRAYEF